LDEGAGQQAAAEASRVNPGAVVSREGSQTRFEGEDEAQAAQTLGEAFPAVVGEQDGGPPPLAAGERALGFESANVEQVEAGSGYVDLVESTAPLAVSSGGGHWAAVNLALREAGGGFEAQNPVVGVRIPKRLAEGAQVSNLGVSITPVDEHGVPLGGSEGVVDGAGVFFANTQTDTDTLLKPSSLGLDASTVLRSIASPEVLYYEVGLPQGARLVASPGGVGAEVVEEGAAVAVIRPPVASDAAGTAVPVSMSVSGDMLVVSVKHGEGSYQYPILVDPEFWEVWSNVVAANWGFHEWNYWSHEIAGSELRMQHGPTNDFAGNDYAYFTEKTKGYTKIYEVYVDKVELYPWSSPEGKARDTPGWLLSYIETYKNPEGTENRTYLTGSPYATEATVCGAGGCASPEDASNGNQALVEITTTEEGSTSEQFYLHVGQVSTEIGEEKGDHSTVSYNTGASEIENEPNVLANGGSWLGPRGKLEYKSTDGGLGVAEAVVEVDRSGIWEKVRDKNYQETSGCAGVQCEETQHEVLTYKMLTENGAKPLPEPEAKIRVSARSPEPYTWSSEHGEGETTIKVDDKRPHGITVSGLPAKGTEGKELTLGEGAAQLEAEASEGEGTTPSSGIKEIRLYIDGREIGQGGGACAPGPCVAGAKWQLKGAEFGVGAHPLTVLAESNTGTLEYAEYTLNVYAASPVAAGPGSVNPESGDFALEASDVNLSGGLGSLTLSRHYDSRNLKEGEEGPFGAPWNAGLGSLASLEVLPEGSVMVIGPTGLTYFKAKSGGGYEAPEGDSNLELKYEPNYESSGKPAYLFKDAKEDTTTVFELPEHTRSWMPVVSKGPTATNTTTDEYRSVEVSAGKWVIQPILEVAPHPNVECSKGHWNAGCRALEFVYDETTTATGEAESEWKGYTHRLKEVIAIAYNPATKKIGEVPVAAYLYDKQGRLRAEWNPSIKPALKTIYGYNSENQVTAVTPSGQEPWLMHYGTTAQDTTSGRLLSVGRLGVKNSSWNGEVLKNTAVPTLSTTSPVIGTTLSVTNGSWSTSSVLYGYKWEDCNSSGAECVVIPGAVNQTYTPQVRDAGYTLVAQVTADGSWGAVAVASAASKAVAMPAPTYSSTFGSSGSESEKLADPAAVAVDSEGNRWVADWTSNRVVEFSPTGAFLHAYSPDSMLEPVGVAFSPTNGYIYVTNRGHGRIDEISPSTGALIRSFSGEGTGLGKLKEPAQVAIDSHGNVWVADKGNKRVDEFSAVGTYLASITNNGERNSRGEQKPLEAPVGVAECGGMLWVTDEAADTLIEYADGGGYIATFGGKGTGNGQFEEPRQVACEPVGDDIYVVDAGNKRVEEFNQAGSFLEKFGASSGEGAFSMPAGIAVGAAGTVYVTDQTLRSVKVWKASYSTSDPIPTPPALTENPVSTIEYNVPLSGSGLQSMTSGEVAKWAQKDDPVEGAAIFPADEPMGWPAANYNRATIYYQDEQMRTVNVASPTGDTSPGAISTSEFNGENEVVRSLSAENRATALKESNPAAASELLDTKSAYNEKGELTDTWGPQHTVKLAKGKSEANEKTLARNHVKYFYDEGAPEGEPHELVTKVVDGAETPSKEEFDQRTATTSYSGQSNLGWELRKPTSVTTDPGGLNLTSTVKYEKATGDIIESQSPAAAGKDASVPPAYAAQFGSKGTGAGQLEAPAYDAIDAHGDVWVPEYGSNRVSEFSASGAFMETIGWGVSNGKAEYQICTSGCKAGLVGSGKGQFDEPTGIAIAGGDIYVVDTGNSRVEVMNEKNEYVTQWGSEGTEKSQFKTPLAIAVSPSKDVWVGDSLNRRLQEFSSSGTFIEAIGWGVSNGKSEYEVCTTTCQAGIKGSGNGEFASIWGLTFSGSTLYVVDTGNNRVQEINEKSEYAGKFGAFGAGNGDFGFPIGIVAGGAGDLYVTDSGNNRIEEFTQSGTYLAQFGSPGSGPGQFDFPEGSAINSSGDIYQVDDLNHRVEEWVPTITGNEGAHDTKTIYYTAKEEASVSTCRNHPEWVDLPCQTEPVAQPGENVPQLPITDTTYNMWDQPATIAEKFGSTERTRSTTFEESGRPLETQEKSSTEHEEKSGASQALPKVVDKYNEHNGSLETQSTTVGEKTETTTSVENALGELERYTDADGNTATYKRDIDGRVTELTDGSEEAAKKDGYEGWQKYHYDEATGDLTKLEDSAAETFTASYTIGGKIAKENYPNGMTATYTINPAGQDTGVEYKKETHCTEKCVWFSDEIVPSIHGETITQASSLSKETYNYATAGWLNQVQEEPTGEGCKTRIYSHDEESNRTTLTSREPAAEGKCASEGGTTEWHTYDTANHLTDPGVGYDPFGDTTTLPASDAGGTALTSSFYVDSQLYKQTQNGTTIEYLTDPEDRTRETITSSGAETTKVISHYDGPGNTLAWTLEPTTGKWTRNIPGIDGTLTATQTNSTAPVLLLHDLQGNVVGEASISETETKLLKTYNSTEYGVPTTKSAPPKYAWLGATGLASELPSGTITQDGSTYVPQTGRPLQTEEIEAPQPLNAVNAYVREEDTVEWGAISGALRVAEYQQAKHAQQLAQDPPGAVPAASCDEETESCGLDPSHGLNPWRCEVWVSWGHGIHLNNYLAVHGHWKCGIAPPDIEIQIALLRIVNGDYVVEFFKKHTFPYPGLLGPTGGEFAYGEGCFEGATYQAWVYGRTWDAWNGETNWTGDALDGHTEKCPPGYEDPTGGPGTPTPDP
jgi:DNA-binding beta-propeller fold protein YncE